MVASIDPTAPPSMFLDESLIHVEMHISQEEMARNKVPLHWRDYCAHLFVERQDCLKRKTIPMPWDCKMQTNAWEKCQYDEYIRRMRILEKQNKQKEAELKALAKQAALA